MARFYMSCVALICGLGLTALGIARPVSAADAQVYDRIAAELIAGINGAPVASLSAASGYGAPSIAVQTESDTDALEGAETQSRRLLAAIGRTAPGRFRLVALDSLDDLIIAIKAQGLSADEERDRIQTLRANARADIFVHGRLRNGTVSYQAISSATGELLAMTADHSIGGPVIAVAARANPVSVPDEPEPGLPYRPTVEEAESLLFQKGYDPGLVDGYLTPKTREAIRAYQRDSALPVNGRLTRRVVTNLRRDARINRF